LEPEPSGPPRSSLHALSTAASDTADQNSNPALIALARFEFETGRGNEGTKILMVEWDPLSAKAEPRAQGDWEVSWEGKKTFLPTSDQESGTQKRVYFLLPPGAPIPPLITITQPHGPTIETKPLPAIFAPGLGVSHRDVGKRGVLHTIWAKKRLSELQDEIKSEMQANGESVGLEMAMQEVKWIQEHFGIGESYVPNPSGPLPSPMSPRSPTGGRLGEKLKGLKLATSPADLVAGPGGKNTRAGHFAGKGGTDHAVASRGGPNVQFSGWSPVDGDIAVSSFASFPGRGGRGSTAGDSGTISLDAALHSVGYAGEANGDEGDKEEDLFALPMSPRSPEMKRSPFSLL
jgi:hypothetical protein